MEIAVFIVEFLVFYTISAWIHEISHALMAAILKVRIDRITIGEPILVSFKIGETDIQFGPLLTSGNVTTEDQSAKNYYKLALVSLAGPLSNLVVAIVIYKFLGLNLGFNSVGILQPMLTSLYNPETFVQNLRGLYSPLVSLKFFADINLFGFAMNSMLFIGTDGGNTLYRLVIWLFGTSKTRVVNTINYLGVFLSLGWLLYRTYIESNMFAKLIEVNLIAFIMHP